MSQGTFSDAVARELRILRTAHGLSNHDLAQLVGVSASVITKTLGSRQRIDIELTVALAEALGESPRDLFDRAGEHYEQ